MLTRTALGTPAELRSQLLDSGALADDDEQIVAHHGPTAEQRLRSPTRVADAMADAADKLC